MIQLKNQYITNVGKKVKLKTWQHTVLLDTLNTHFLLLRFIKETNQVICLANYFLCDVILPAKSPMYQSMTIKPVENKSLQA